MFNPHYNTPPEFNKTYNLFVTSISWFIANLITKPYIQFTSHNCLYCQQPMCITFFCLQPQTGQKHNIEFLIGFNRDERTQRDTEVLGPFKEDPNIYAGRDKISTGTWLGVNVKTGIMVILTNYDLQVGRVGKSRGKLVMSFLKTAAYEGLTPAQYNQHIKSSLCSVLKQRQQYSAFNLVVYSIQTSTIFYICSELPLQQPQILQKNFPYGMCNGPLDDLWEKTKHGLGQFEKVVDGIGQKHQNQVKEFFMSETKTLLQDDFKFDQNLEKESAIFVEPYYSQTEKAERMTKCSFVCMVRRVDCENKGGNDTDKKFVIDMREVTYTSPELEESQVEYRCVVGVDCLEGVKEEGVKEEGNK